MAKPENWDSLPAGTKKTIAEALLMTVRGRLIIGQALATAAVTIKGLPHPYKEISNAEDMEILGEGVFEPFYSLSLEKMAAVLY